MSIRPVGGQPGNRSLFRERQARIVFVTCAGLCAYGCAGTAQEPVDQASASNAMQVAAQSPPMQPAAMQPAAAMPAAATPVTTGAEPAPTMAMAAPMPAPPPDPLQHCRMASGADARDAALKSEPVRFDAGAGRMDLLLPEAVQAWMDERKWPQMHNDWHDVRKWDSQCRQSNTPETGGTCMFAQQGLQRGLRRAAIQQCAPGDGYAFLMMHRHMIETLEAAFPNHTDVFAGFAHVPKSQDDPENPMPWRSVAWTSDQLTAIDRLEHIEDHLDLFATEDDLARYMQCSFRWTAENPTAPTTEPSSGIHRGLHAQWSIVGSPASLANQAVDIVNYVFWKLHGWMDDVWERYRVAKGITREDATYQRELLAECEEMHQLSGHTASPPGTPGIPQQPTVPETGFFAERLRPFIDDRCGACHGTRALNPEAGLTLGGPGISSADIITGIVRTKATNGEYDLIAPGNAERSWVYLKASGGASSATCMTACQRGIMPPAGEALSADQLALLKQWIDDGAPGPN